MRSVSVRSMPGHPYAMEINDGRHVLVSDEEPDAGGDDLGPIPYELLMAGLGSCMAITLLMYARRKEWPVEDVKVDVSYDKVRPEHCAECSEEERSSVGPSGRIDLFRISLAVKGDLSEEQLTRLLDIANRCPVHRTIEAAPKFISEIALLS